MFGYIKPYVPSLSVGEYEAYKAAYCGLCRTMGHMTGQASRLALSYDVSFLAIFRMAMRRIPTEFDKSGCIAHPVKKRLFMKENSELEFCAFALAALTKGKIEDNIQDERSLKKFANRLMLPYANRLEKKVSKLYAHLNTLTDRCIKETTALEKEKCASIDKAASPTAELISQIASFGLDEREAKIARVIGYSIGKFVYVLDAADDLAEDIKSEKYNPIALMYTDPLEYCKESKKQVLKKSIAEELYTAVGLEANRAADALEYIDFEGMATYKGIVTNVLTLGLRAEAGRVLLGKGESENPMKHTFSADFDTDSSKNNQQ